MAHSSDTYSTTIALVDAADTTTFSDGVRGSGTLGAGIWERTISTSSYTLEGVKEGAWEDQELHLGGEESGFGERTTDWSRGHRVGELGGDSAAVREVRVWAALLTTYRRGGVHGQQAG